MARHRGRGSAVRNAAVGLTTLDDLRLAVEPALDRALPPEDAWGKVQDEAERRGLIQRGRIGRAECMLFKARAVVGIYERFLRDDAFGLFGVEKGT